LLRGKFTRLPVYDLSLLINNKSKRDRINPIAQLMRQGNAGNATD
jgi:hypothetical protein